MFSVFSSLKQCALRPARRRQCSLEAVASRSAGPVHFLLIILIIHMQHTQSAADVRRPTRFTRISSSQFRFPTSDRSRTSAARPTRNLSNKINPNKSNNLELACSRFERGQLTTVKKDLDYFHEFQNYLFHLFYHLEMIRSL